MWKPACNVQRQRPKHFDSAKCVAPTKALAGACFRATTEIMHASIAKSIRKPGLRLTRKERTQLFVGSGVFLLGLLGLIYVVVSAGVLAPQVGTPKHAPQTKPVDHRPAVRKSI